MSGSEQPWQLHDSPATSSKLVASQSPSDGAALESHDTDESTHVTERADCRGQLCPFPVLTLARLVANARADHAAKPDDSIARGQIVFSTGLFVILADDVAAVTDIPAWCRMRGAKVVQCISHDAFWEFQVRAPLTSPA